MALFRALESTRAAGRRLFEDRLAATFLEPSLRAIARASRVAPLGTLARSYIDHRWPGARSSAVARTRFIDDAVQAALAAGIAQVVILGAGYDARAYRLPALRGVAVYELDHPSTSAAKRDVVARVLAVPPRHVRFVAADFDAIDWHGAVAAAGYDPRRPTLFIWEGVTNYLTAPAVDATLRWCAGAAPGSRVVFTYVDRRVLETPAAFAGTERLLATLAAAGERWTFGLDPADVGRFLAERGLVLEEDVGAAEYRARYFGAAARRMVGYEFYRIAVARIEARAQDTAG